MKSVDNIRRGDNVERVRGKHVGILGKVVARKPAQGLVTTHVKVQINFKDSGIVKEWRALYNRYFRDKWTPVAGWRRVFDE